MGRTRSEPFSLPIRWRRVWYGPLSTVRVLPSTDTCTRRWSVVDCWTVARASHPDEQLLPAPRQRPHAPLRRREAPVLDRIMDVRDRICEDVRTYLDRDPAATSVLEVVLCYPGLHAVWGHRLAHALWTRNHVIAARLLSQLVRFGTGIEIHPAATIGHRFVIDHGMGVVIGATAEIGDDVHCYHSVTLGARTGESGKRHPTVADDAVLGAGATILGDVAVGADARVGAGAVVVDSVPADTTVVGVPARPIDEERSNDVPSADDGDTTRSRVDRCDLRRSTRTERPDVDHIVACRPSTPSDSNCPEE